MWRSPEPGYGVASEGNQCSSAYNEDASVTELPFGTSGGHAVLADGIGGHNVACLSRVAANTAPAINQSPPFAPFYEAQYEQQFAVGAE